MPFTTQSSDMIFESLTFDQQFLELATGISDGLEYFARAIITNEQVSGTFLKELQSITKKTNYLAAKQGKTLNEQQKSAALQLEMAALTSGVNEYINNGFPGTYSDVFATVIEGLTTIQKRLALGDYNETLRTGLNEIELKCGILALASIRNLISNEYSNLFQGFSAAENQIFSSNAEQSK